MPKRILILANLCWLATAALLFAEDIPRDPGFSSVGRPDSAWQLAADKDGKVEPAQAADGKTSAVHIKAAALTQRVTLTDGFFELTVEGKGQGELILGISGAGERTQMLGKDWGTYGYLFQADAGERTVSIRVTVEGTLTAAAIRPATDEQKTAWALQQKGVVQFGFITVSAQRPSLGSAPLQFKGNVKPLEAMTRRAVLDEPRIDTHNVTRIARLLQWLGDNGFERLDGEKIADWMAARIKANDAYGSVVVLANGIAPSTLFARPPTSADKSEGKPGAPLWIRFLRAGGRIVYVGNLPFYTVQSPTVAPCGEAALEPSLGMPQLGFDIGWHSPYWGQGNLAVTRTSAADAWGIEILDGSVLGIAVENVSLAFGVYTVPATGKQGAATWFKNVRPDLPWSGLIRMPQVFDGNNDVALRDTWRAAHYVGKPVAIPTLPPKIDPPPAPMLRLTTIAGGMTNRHEFVRGEQVSIQLVPDVSLKANQVRLELLDGSNCLWSQMQTFTNGSTSVVLDTGPYADRAYTLRATALAGEQIIARQSEPVGIRHLPPESFNFEVGHAAGINPLRADMEFADIRDTGMELYLGEVTVAGLDAVVRHHMGFSLRAHPDFLMGKQVTFEANPEYFRLDNHGKPFGTAGTGGRPSLNLSHPEIRANAVKSMEAAVKTVARLPSFRPYVLSNDDFSMFYGWDYSPHVREAFKKDTGLEAPREMIKPEKFGAIPDNQPWVKWFEWTLINVNGAFNKAETEGVVRARSDARIGPIPGGMQIPLVQLWEPAQYPPYNFGKNGFNLICSYYYNCFWQPVMTATFWMEIGRMGNRDLPQWNMPDCFNTAGYSRNNFYLYLAGGVRGLAYFMYTVRTENNWPEFKRLGKIVRRLGPVQIQLTPAKRTIGFLNSFTANCFDPGHTLVQVYAYNNLMQGHFDVEMVSEDEICDGRAAQYKAILLYNIQYLRQSIYDALAKYAAGGGLVLLDRSIPFEIPGAKRLNVDIGMGTESTKPFPPEGAHLSTPGIHDCGHANRIAVIKKALSEYVKPWFESDDIKLVAMRFETDGVPYTWFVNVHNAKEYMFCRERLANHPKPKTPESIKEVQEWEAREMARGPYVSAIVMDSLPGMPYDLVSGKEIPVRKTADGRFALTVSMERFGGTLVAWLPEAIASLKLEAPRTARPGETLKALATLQGQGGWLGFGTGRKIPGALAVEFVLKDPNGRESVVSGVRATRDGTAAWEWTPAVNDPAGKWMLTATDLTSGKTAQHPIRLNQE